MKYIKLYTVLALLSSFWGLAQCNTANFTVTKTNGTCFSNGSITVNVPTSTNCSDWTAQIIKLPSGTPIQQSVPTTGGAVVFSALQAGSYQVTLSNPFTTVPYTSNPVVLTTSYVNMNISTSSTAPTCRNNAPGYTPNGTLTINVANGTGLGPFLYSVTSSTGTQSFTSSNRSYTFSNMPGAEQVNISVTDLANNDSGCAVTVSQSPTTVQNLSNPMSFDFRPFNYERDCSSPSTSCNNVRLFVNLSNVNAASLANLQLAGNAKITIAGVDYPLTYVSGSARFRYDPVAVSGPPLQNGDVITTTFNGGCNTISKTSTVSMDNNFLTVNATTETVFANCSVRYRFTILGDRDVSGGTGFTDRATYFCATNSLKFELRNPDGVTYTDVTSTITNSAGVPLSGTNPMAASLGTSIPSVNSTWYATQPGFYRVTATDDCHTQVRTVNVTTTNPFGSPVQAVETTSVLEGTSSIFLWFNSLPPLGSPLTATVTRFDGQTSMTINPTQPLSKAGSYTIDFPIIRTFNYPIGGYTFSDLPPGRYIVELTNSCSSTTGLKGTYDVTLVKPTSYTPTFSVTNGCTGSNAINYNMNPVNAKTSPYTVKLYTNNGSGGLGSLVATSTSNTLSGSFINLNSGNYIISFENVTPVDNFNGYSAAFASGAAQTYTKAITIEPYTDIGISTSTAVCDVNTSNSGIINAQVSSGTIVYPMTFTLYAASNLSTAVQGPFMVTSPTNNYTFTGLATGNYVVKVTNPCYTINSNVTISNTNTAPSAQVSNATVCPNSPTTLGVISATNNLYDITWRDNNNVVVGTGMPVTLTPSATTTYTASYVLKSTFGCPNPITYTSDVTVTVTPNPDLTLAVSDINLCDGTAPSVTISNTQSGFSYEIVNSSGTSFSPPLTANGNGGSVTIAIPNTITLTAGQILKVKASNGNAGCSGILTDVSNVLNGTFTITCPTFPSTSVQCYADLPSKTSFTIAEFQALGNGNGIVDVVGCGVVEITATNGADPSSCNANVIRTYTITEYADPNNNGVRNPGENTVLNTKKCTQTININDTTQPVVTGTLTASSVSGCSISDKPVAMTTVSELEAAGLTIADNCTIDNNLVVTSSDGTASGTCPITFTRTYTITDACNNATTATQTININDTTKPVITGTLTASSVSGCSLSDKPVAMTTVSELEAAGLTIADNCTIDNNLVVTSSDGTASGTCPITFTRTYTITDACNNATTATQTININDTTQPVITGTLTASSVSGCSLSDKPVAMTTVSELEAAGLTIADNCTIDNNLVVTSSDGTASGTCPITFTRTYTITDACNNATTATQTININDTTKPVITGTLTASSVSGCSLSDKPVAMTTVSELEAAGLTIADNCTIDNNLVVTSSDGTASGTCPITFTRTYTITDACNNATTATQTININDTTQPVITGTLTASSVSGCSISDKPVAMTTVSELEAAGLTIADNCTIDNNLVVTSSDGTASGTCPITFTRTYTITDACNNATTATQTININDTTQPVITGTLTASSVSGCSISDKPVAMTTVSELEAAGLTIADNCTIDNNLVVTSSDGTASGTCPITFTRTYTITDACNNATTATQTININDTTQPVITGALTASSVSGCSISDKPAAMTTVSELEAEGLTIADNCTTDSNLVVTSSDGTASGTCPITFTRTYTITDACSNATTATQTININDTTQPVITGTLTASSVSGCSVSDKPAAMTTVSELEAEGLTIADNCTTDSNLVVTSSDGTASGTCPITFTRTYTITDACNNTTLATQTININDTTQPVITGTLTDSSVSGCSVSDKPVAMTTVSELEAAGLTIADNCTTEANLVVTSSDGTASGTCPITFTRTYTITDACSNATTATQTININDTTQPVITGTLTASNVSGCSLSDKPVAMATVAELEAAGLTIADNCTTDANLVVTSSDGTASGTCPITFTRTYTITDACNNATTATQTININDTTKPVITGTLTASSVSGCSLSDKPVAMTTVSELEAAGLTIADNCTTEANLVVTSSDGTASGTCPITFTRTYTITDACNNTTLATQTININDTTQPVITGTLTDSSVSGCSVSDKPVAMTTVSELEAAGLTIADNCTIDNNLVVTIQEYERQGTCPIHILRVYVIKDACNNETAVTQNIYINDVTQPVITGILTASNVSGCSLSDKPVAMATVAELEAAGLTIADNCTTDANLVVTSSDGTASGTCPITFTRTYTITDACNNATTATQTININDTTKPVITGTLTASSVSGCSLSDKPVAMTTVSELEAAGLTIADNCTIDNNLVVTSSDGTASGTCPITFTRTYTITDACNNATTATQTININDTTAPVITGILTASSVSGCSVSDKPVAMTTVSELEAAGLTIADNCTTEANLVVTSSDGTASGTCPITFTRTYTITDACSNATTATQTININDTTQPVITGTLTASSVSGCSVSDKPVAMTTVSELEAAGLTIADNCTTDANLVVTSSDGTASGTYPITFVRTYTIIDACNNFTKVDQRININETQTPFALGATISNNCPFETVDLTTLQPAPVSGILYEWWTGTASSRLTQINNTTSYDTSGKVYLWSKRSTGACYSALGSEVNVLITPCCVANVGTISVSNIFDNYYEPANVTNLSHTNYTSMAIVRYVLVNKVDGKIKYINNTEPKFLAVAAGNYTAHALVFGPTANPTGIEIGNKLIQVQPFCGTSATVDIIVYPNDCKTEDTFNASIANARDYAFLNLNTNTFDQVNTTGIFSNPKNGILYQIVGFNYTGTATGIQVGGTINGVTATNLDITTGEVVTGCSPVTTQIDGVLYNDKGKTCKEGNNTQEGLPNTTLYLKLIDSSNTVVQVAVATQSSGYYFTFSGIQDGSYKIIVDDNDTISDITATYPSGWSGSSQEFTIEFGQIVEFLSNNANFVPMCMQSTTTVVATDDAVSGIDGFSGVKNVLNILTNDFVDAANATINNVSISVITPDATGKIVLNPDGSVDVKPGTPAGVYTLVYEICTINTPKVCDQATVTITVVVPVIIAVNDDYSSKPIDASKGVILDILGNDKINNGTVSPSQVTITILDTNGLAGVTVDAQGKIVIPAGIPIGTYVLTYRICDVINPSNCATATVTIVVKDPCDFDDSAASCDIVIHNAFSPNNDGINEVFFIERIEKYPDNSVEIYNRWGILVFEVSGYDNTSKVFVGLSEGRVTVNKADTLPSGTYYYVVKYKKPISGIVNQKAGFLYISK